MNIRMIGYCFMVLLISEGNILLFNRKFTIQRIAKISKVA